ncbi:MAG: DUF58 domain-containing protein [Pirellulales bacterium]
MVFNQPPRPATTDTVTTGRSVEDRHPSAAVPLLPPDLLARLERLEMVTRKVFRGRTKGERRSKRKGQSVEFADFRSYVPGDDLRFLDWNLYARLDRLFVKMFLEEEDLHFYTLLDASRSMEFGDPTKLQYAKQLAAALGFVALIRSDRVKIETMGQPLGGAAPTFRGRRSARRMVEALEQIEPGESVSLAEGVKNFCLRNAGKGVVVVMTDLMDKAGYEAAFKRLASQQLDVYIIHILSMEEIEPDVKGDLKLVDCEDQDVAEISVNGPLLKRYEQTLAGLVDGARTYCMRRGMNYLLVNTSLPVLDLITTYLRRQGLVR